MTNKLKTFFVFGFDDHYIKGGMDDFIKSFHTKEEAEKYVSKAKIVIPHPYKRRNEFGENVHDYYEIKDISEHLCDY